MKAFVLSFAAAVSMLPAAPAIAQNAAAYDLQERCGIIARSINGDGQKTETSGDAVTTTMYSNNYSTKFNSCFVLESQFTVKDHRLISKLLSISDVNRNKQIGFFFENYSDKSMICSVATVNCSGEQEFNKLSEPYMN